MKTGVVTAVMAIQAMASPTPGMAISGQNGVVAGASAISTASVMAAMLPGRK